MIELKFQQRPVDVPSDLRLYRRLAAHEYGHPSGGSIDNEPENGQYLKSGTPAVHSPQRLP